MTFAMPAGTASAPFNPGNALTMNAVTNASGVATTATKTIKATATAGTYTATASAAGIVTPASFGLTNQ